jgi:hypothetical protein
VILKIKKNKIKIVVNFLQFCCNHALKKIHLKKSMQSKCKKQLQCQIFYFIFLELASSGGRGKTHQTLSAN